MRISIAMATYNGERFIREQLDSLARQTLQPCELVVCDDGSTDRTPEIVEDFAKTAPFPVRIYHNERNLGFADNFLKAASLCEGDWIAFCDQDDVWLQHKLAVVSKHVADIPTVVLVMHSGNIVDANLVPQNIRLPDYTKCRLFHRLQRPIWSELYTPGYAMVFKAELVRDIPNKSRPLFWGSFDSKQSHDSWIFFLANIIGNVLQLPQSLVLYRRHESAYTGNYKPRSFHSSLRRSMSAGAGAYEKLAEGAGGYGEFLGYLAEQAAAKHRNRIEGGQAFYELFRDRYRLRASLYDAPPGLGRGRIFIRLLTSRCFFSYSPEGFGRKALLKDFIKCFLPNKQGIIGIL